MKHFKMAALALAIAASLAQADDIVIPPPTVSCVPPLLWRTTRCECQDGSVPLFTSYGTPLCAAPQPPLPTAMCSVTISYPAASPAVVAIARDPVARCDDAGVDLALAVALARRLGAP